MKSSAGFFIFPSLILVAGVAHGAVLTRGPYLQLPGTSTMTIVWNTDVPAACALRLRPLDGQTTVVAGGTGTVCAVPLAGLAPATRYAYVPLADDVPLAEESVFRTDDPAGPFTFLVFGDSGGAGPWQYAVRDAMAASPADFLVHTGDMIYESGAAADFDPKFFTPYAPLLRRMVLWPCLGNHDNATSRGGPWRDAFYTPANNLAGSEAYYSFDYGNAHFVMLDTNISTTPGSAQYTFLEQDLNASGATWKFVVFHHPPYTSGAHGDNLKLQANLLPLFDAHAVDIVFTGHDHDYERTVALRANEPAAPGTGTVYIVTGGGGESIRTMGTSSYTAYAESAFHFTRVHVDGGALRLQMVRDDGAVRDELTLEKEPGAEPRCGDGLVNRPAEQCDGADRLACRAGCAPDCTCLPRCGDGLVNQPSETCDGDDDAACPGLCFASCVCGDPGRIVMLAPVADTYIESGTESARDHGAADHLDVDVSPTDVTYLKFDLTGIAAPVKHATLQLSCTNPAPDGGFAFPVADSGWVEGDRTGSDAESANGPGLKWTDVDTNADGVLDTNDTSPYRPDFARWFGSPGAVAAGKRYAVDVTDAVRSGELVTIAVANASNNGARYDSREAPVADRPALRLELASLSGTTTTGTVTTTTTSTTTTTTLGPAVATVEADTFVRELDPAANFGASPLLEIDHGTGRRERIFLRVEVSGVAGRPVAGARLRLRVAPVKEAGGVAGGSLRAITDCSWGELAVTWESQPALDGPVLASAGAVAIGDVVDFDVSGAITGDGTYCFALDTRSKNGVTYGAREGSIPGPEVLLDVAP